MEDNVAYQDHDLEPIYEDINEEGEEATTRRFVNQNNNPVTAYFEDLTVANKG